MLLALAKMFKADKIPSVARRKGLTQVELLVVAGIVTFAVLLLLLVLPRMSRPYRQAPGVACMANLKQWGLVFKLYTDDHDGSFVSGEGGDNGKRWFEPLRPYIADAVYRLCLCPTAKKPRTRASRNHFVAWKVGDVSGSYGLNAWIYHPVEGKADVRGGDPLENYWGTLRSLRGKSDIPILADAMWFEGWPRHSNKPPPDENWPGSIVDANTMKANQNEMRRFCVNRHMGHVNVLFMDWSVRKVGIKELWMLKWHRNYDVEGPWTKAGGVQPDDWPFWMQGFKDY